MLAATQNAKLQFWLGFMLSQNSILSSTGTIIWQEGVDLLNSLELQNFFLDAEKLNFQQIAAFQLIDQILQNNKLENFDISGDLQLKNVSPIYKHIQKTAESNQLQYFFTSDEQGEFNPWSTKVMLGTKFYKLHNGQVKVPFYSFNHENAHIALFGKFYSNLDLSKDDFNELLLLIEWFCISLDLILAYDLIKSNKLSCLSELETITNCYQRNKKLFFKEQCQTIQNINLFADKFRASLINSKFDETVNELISFETLEYHISYSKNILSESCIKHSTNVSKADAQSMLDLLRNQPLNTIINTLTGLKYEI